MYEPSDAIAQHLTDHGDTVAIPGGKTLRLTIEPDQDSGGWNDQMDAECYGTVEWSSNGRPSSFDGSARIVYRDGYEACWWQPPTAKAIGTVWTQEQWTEQTAYVRDRIEYGWSLVGLHLLETITDSKGNEHTVTVDSAYLGGVDDTSPAYLPEVIQDLAAELL